MKPKKCCVPRIAHGIAQQTQSITFTTAARAVNLFQVRFSIRLEMRGVPRTITMLKDGVLQSLHVKVSVFRPRVFSRVGCTASAPRSEYKALEFTTVADLLKAKGHGDGPLLWCCTDDTVYDAVKNMTQNNVGSLVVVKPGEKKLIAGIVTERDYLKKVIIQGRSSQSTKVKEIMTDENKLVTVTSDTSILQAMQLMTDKQIRHLPVIEAKVVGMISIVDVIHGVLKQQREEAKRLKDFIRGKYY